MDSLKYTGSFPARFFTVLGLVACFGYAIYLWVKIFAYEEDIYYSIIKNDLTFENQKMEVLITETNFMPIYAIKAITTIKPDRFDVYNQGWDGSNPLENL